MRALSAPAGKSRSVLTWGCQHDLHGPIRAYCWAIAIIAAAALCGQAPWRLGRAGPTWIMHTRRVPAGDGRSIVLRIGLCAAGRHEKARWRAPAGGAPGCGTGRSPPAMPRMSGRGTVPTLLPARDWHKAVPAGAACRVRHRSQGSCCGGSGPGGRPVPGGRGRLRRRAEARNEAVHSPAAALTASRDPLLCSPIPAAAASTPAHHTRPSPGPRSCVTKQGRTRGGVLPGAENAYPSGLP